MNPLSRLVGKLFKGSSRGPVPNQPNATGLEVKKSAVGHLLAGVARTQLIGFSAAHWTGRTYDQLAREGYRKNAVAHRVVRIIAECAASVPLLLFRGDQRLTRHPLLDLLARPNPLQSGIELMESLYAFLEIAGNSYLEASELASGRPGELYVLRPDRMRIVPGPNGWPIRYEYKVGGRTTGFPVDQATGAASVMHIRTFHPQDDYYGLSTLEAAAFGIESVTIKAGGSENRYTCNGWINPERPHKTNVEAILSSMAGVLVFQSGKWNVYVGTTRTATKSRTTDEIVGGVAIQTKRSTRDKINSVRGVFPDSAKGYEAADYPPRQNSTYITDDGGEELWLDLNLPLTTSGSTAQRLAKISLERARRELSAQLIFNLTALQDQAMDAITFTHAPLNLSSQKFLIADWALKAVADGENIGLIVEETLIEEADAIYDWTAATDEVTIPAQGTQTRVDTLPTDSLSSNLMGFEADDFTDTSNWTETGGASISAANNELTMTQQVSQTAEKAEWKEVAPDGELQTIALECSKLDGEGGFLIGDKYARIVSNNWQTPAGVNTGFSKTDTGGKVGPHLFVLKVDNTFDWYINGVLVKSGEPFTPGGVIGLQRESNAGGQTIISDWRHYNKPIDQPGGAAPEMLVGHQDPVTVGEGGVRASTALVPGGNVAPGITQDQGDQTFRPFVLGLADILLEDGDSFIYSSNWQNPPVTKTGPGGKTTDTGLTDPVNQQIEVQNPTASGGDLSARLVEDAGTPALQTETTNGEAGQDFSKTKAVAAIGWDNKYTIQIDVTVGKAQGTPEEPEPTTVTIEYYYKDGAAGWALIGTNAFINNDTTTTKQFLNNQKTFTVTGVAQNDDFGVSKGTEVGNPSTLDAMDNFTYFTATAPSDVSATGTGTGDIKVEVQGPDAGGVS